MIQLRKVEYPKGTYVFLSWDQKNIKIEDQLKTIKGLRYSKKCNAYYFKENTNTYRALYDKKLIKKPYNKSSFQTFKMANKEDYTGHTKLDSSTDTPTVDTSICKPKDPTIVIDYSNSMFFIKMEYNIELIKKIKELQAAYWSPKQKRWICKATQHNLMELQSIFKYWDFDEYTCLQNLVMAVEFPKKLHLYLIPEKNRTIAIKLTGFGIDLQYIKQVPGREYDRSFKRWLIPFENVILSKLISHYESKGVQIINRLPNSNEDYYKWDLSHGEKQKKLIHRYPLEYRQLVEKYTNTMILQRYSWSTIQSYTSSIIRFQIFMGTCDIAEAELTDVNRYISHISRQKISFNEINRHCSAIKFLFEKVMYTPHFEVEKIKRPRKSKTLPKVLSKKQIKQLFAQIKNQKHLCMLYLLYNGGLRSGELISIRIQDIQWDRSQLFIEGGKGKKDRVVMLGEVMKNMLQEYADEYKPSYWLFEGFKPGHPYSANSLRNIVKKAAKGAGITQKVTTHTIRHCFATHLLESGTNIRLIQELLGHSDIKTTLIYTHITKDSASSVISPLDLLSLENTKKNNIKG